MGTRSSEQANIISRFRAATGASEEDAYCYLETTNWNINQAFNAWRMDQRKAG